MTTQNPRLTITLQPTIAAQLRELSRLTGNSQSSLISELLDGSTAVFDRVIQVLTAAEGAKQALKGKLSEDMEKAQSRVEAQLGLVMEDFDNTTGALIDEMEAITRRGRRQGQPDAAAPAARPRARSATPPSNRGVRSDPTTIKKIAQKLTGAGPKPTKSKAKSRGGV